jgi:hypothetical protein
MKKIREVYGAVAIVDALGARTFTVGEGSRFLKARRRIEERVRSSHDLGKWLEDLVLKGTALDLEVRTFGDTVVLAWRFDEADALQAGRTIHSALATLVIEGLAEGIAWRGAVAIGEYVIDRTSVLGPAVSDAASWYEALDWIGIVATPRAREILTSVAGQDEAWFADWTVPYSRRATAVKLFAVDWPNALLQTWLDLDCDDADRPPTSDIADELEPPAVFECQAKLAAAFAKFSMPFGTESKYENARSFFDARLPVAIARLKNLQESLRKKLK